jgi:hypothetical protein
MSNIPKLHALIGAACLAIALAVVGDAFAQEQSDESQTGQSEQSQQQSSDEQDQQSPSQSGSESTQQAQEKKQREQQERERKEQSQQRDRQSQDRDQSSWDDSDRQRERQWPQPNDREYGSDSLRYRDNQSPRRDSQSFTRDSQRGQGNQQGGLGVGLRSDGREGVVVTQVHDGSPADEMGIRQGDRITAVNGQQVQSVPQFIARIRNMEPGEQIELDIRRNRGGEQTVRGELESRDEALADSGQEGQWSNQQRGNWQTSYEDERREYSQNRSGQAGDNRLDQIARQVDRLSREIDQLRVSLQSMRRGSGQPSQWNRERTARYEEYQDTTRQRDDDRRVDGRETYRDSDTRSDSEFRRDSGSEFGRNSGTSERGSRSDGRDSDVDTPGGETGEARLRVGSEDARE